MKKKFTEFKNRLTSVSKEEPLNKLSLAVIIILDIFVLTFVFTGLDEHTQQLTTASEYMPSNARNIFIEQNWTTGNRISKLQPLILSDRNNSRYRYDSPFDAQKIKLMHPMSSSSHYGEPASLESTLKRGLHTVCLCFHRL